MMRLALLALLIPADAMLRGTGQNTDMNVLLNDALHNMHPEAVSKLLHTVELRWETSRSLVLENKTDASEAQQAMLKSCQKVARAIIEGSEGDKDKVVEYMQDVCAVSEEEKKKCVAFSTAMEQAMGDDERDNRDELDLSKFCGSYWAGPVTAAAQVMAKLVADEEAEKAKEEAAAQLEEAVSKSALAMEHVAKVEEEVSNIEASMATDDANATQYLDQARKQDQVAAEKEVKATDTEVQHKAMTEAANVKGAAADVSADEEEALKEGDAEAEAIADKAVEKAEAPVAQKENTTAAAKDDTEAIAAGDALAKKIADKAVKKAALVAKKF